MACFGPHFLVINNKIPVCEITEKIPTKAINAATDSGENPTT